MRLFVIHFLMIISWTSLAGCGGKTETSPVESSSEDGHARMLALLAEIRDRTPRENPFLGRNELEEAQLTLDFPDGKRDDETSILLLARVGGHQLRLGANDDAIERMNLAYQTMTRERAVVSHLIEESITMGVALAYLRQGETKNCVHCQRGESCLLPIRGEGVHQHPEWSRQAIQYLERVLDKNPNHLSARWLLNVAYMTVGDYPDKVPTEHLIPPEAFAAEEEFPLFPNIAAGVGLDTFSLSGGTAVEDFDGDGLLDVIVSEWDTAGQIRYYRNAGDGRFEEWTEQAGLTGLFGGLNLVHADYDNDGDFDVLVLRGAWWMELGRHPNSLLQNDGKGHFRDVTFDAGLGEVHYPTITASFADYDNDGDLDLYIGNEGYPSQLFQNDGSGHFTDVAKTAGVTNDKIAKGVTWGDFNADRLPDLYVSNLDGDNRLYKNLGDGKFVDVAQELGVTGPDRSFPTWFWDYNNDGLLDLYVASYEGGASKVAADYLGLPHDDHPDCFYQGLPDGRFKNATDDLGFTRVTQPMGCNFGDLDNDGFLDFYLGTGDPNYENIVPNLLFHNQRGKRFADVTTAARVGHLQKGHGVAFADFDHDGDQDLFIEMGGAYPGDGFRNALFENPGFNNHWIKLKLVGTQSNRCAIGARMHLAFREGDETRSVYKWVDNGSSFGGNPFRQEIGVGQVEFIDTLEIFWPTTGKTQTFHDVAVDQYIEITEEKNDFRVLPLQRLKLRHPSSKSSDDSVATTPVAD